MIRLVGMLILGFDAWMLHDAYRRRAAGFWYLVILGIPGGAFIYFFAVRAKDRDARRTTDRMFSFFRGPPSLETLQATFEESPSHANRLQLAQGLFDAHHTAEAREHLRALRAQRPEDPDVLFGLGLSELELGEHDAAIAVLRELIERKPSHQDFAAFPVLARALYGSGQVEACMDLLHGLARREPRLPHVVLLARYLYKTGDAAQARATLQTGLSQHDRAPRHVRRQYAHWARVGRRLLAQPPSEGGPALT